MSQLTPEEEKQAVEGAPKGTFALMVLLAAVFAVGWSLLYFGRFLVHGPVN